MYIPSYKGRNFLCASLFAKKCQVNIAKLIIPELLIIGVPSQKTRSFFLIILENLVFLTFGQRNLRRRMARP